MKTGKKYSEASMKAFIEKMPESLSSKNFNALIEGVAVDILYKGELKAIVVDRNAAFRWLHDNQGQSVEWAFSDGWDVKSHKGE